MFTLKWIPKPHMEIVLANQVLNLCDLLVELSHPCPVHPGKYVLFYKQKILSVIPKVTIHNQYPNSIYSTNINFVL